MTYPRISVIIPTYNRQKLLARAIESVLNQTFKDFELIIVDDGSTDNTKEVVREFQKRDSRIKYIWQENSGAPARPKNTGIKNAKGNYIAFLDDDDEWLSEKLEKQLELFEGLESDLGFVGCNILVINESNKKIWREYKIPRYSSQIFFEELLEGNFILTSSSIMIKKEVLDKIGLFDENLKFGDDWDLWLRIAKKYKFDFAPEFLIKYYIHGGNIIPNLPPMKEAREFEYIFTKYQREYEKYPHIYSIHLRQLASRYCASGQMSKGRKYYIQSIKFNSFNLKSYFYLALSFLGKRTFRKFYNFRKSLNK